MPRPRAFAYSILHALSLLALCTLASTLIIGCGAGTSSSTTTTTTTGGGNTGGGSTTGWTGGGDGIWRRNAVYAEIFTFDPCNAHQPSSGEYHYHDNPVCLRYQMGDNITGTAVGTAAASYAESTGTHTHSPVLGWSFDGYPVYGPYGYSSATDALSGVRRMVSSYALRTDDITNRTTLPAWAAAYQGISATLTASQYGPPVSSAYPLGRYVEDYDYTAGSGDLDQYNGRFCVTPDFPNGAYAYFVTIDASGAPAFPYYLGPQYYGAPSGGNVNSITETTTTYFSNHGFQTATSTLPQLTSWLLKYTAQPAAILYDNTSNVVVGPVTTWTANTTAVDADIQTVASSSDYVYLHMSGLTSHMMGPWYNNTARTAPFVNLPTNQNATSRIPLIPTVPATKTATGGGAQGRWANGASMFNMLDFFSWSNASQQDVGPGM